MAKKKKLKTLIFGIDGGDPRIIKFGIQHGLFPNLASLARQGVLNTLRCTWPPHTSTGWPSLFAGKLPGEHGIFQFWNCQDPAYQLKATPSTALCAPILWDYFQELGWNMGLVNIPMSHPVGPWSGFQFTWPLVKTLHYSQPPGLIKQLREGGGLHLPDIAYMYNGEANYPQKAIGLIHKRTQGLLHLLEQNPVEVLAVVYPEVDRVCHHYWHGLDTSHPQFASTTDQERSSILEVYKAMDSAIGELLNAADSEVTTMVVSDHGFGPGVKGFRLHKVLKQAGYCAYQSNNNQVSETEKRTEISGNMNVLEKFDWSKTQVYIPTPGCFGLNFNIKGRQSKGILDPAAIPILQAQVIHFLEDLNDPQSGKKVFKKVLPAKACFAEPYVKHAPDLMLIPNDPSLMVLSGVQGAIWDDSPQVGLHRMEGFCLLSGASNIDSLPNNAVIGIEAVAGFLLKAMGHSSSHFSNEKATIAELDILQNSWSANEDPVLDLSNQLSQFENRAPVEEIELEFPMPKSNDLILERLRGLGYID